MRGDLVLFRGAALEDERLTRADLTILWHIGKHANFKSGWASVSLLRLVRECSRTKRTVLKAIDRLTEYGYLLCRRERTDDGQAFVNQYLVLLDPPDSRRVDRAEGSIPNPSVPESTTPAGDGIPTPPEPYTTVVSDPPESVDQGGIHLPSKGSTSNWVVTSKKSRNTGGQATRAGNPSSGTPRLPSWSAEFSAILVSGIGHFHPGRVGKALKAPVDAVGVERAREVVQAYAAYGPKLDRNGVPQLEINAPQFCSPEKLAQTWAFWMAYTSPLVGANGNGAH